MPLLAATPGLQALARAAFMLLAAVLPFELVAPLGHVGPLALTSVEVALYAALALGAASIAVQGGFHPSRLTARDAALAVFALVLLLSAARAPFLRGPAFKFALRSIGGLAVFFVAARVLRPRGAVLAVAGCLAGGAAVAALLLVAEHRLPGAAAALAPFHGAFDVFGLPRASGPFQYPNIAAMYLEAAMPVALAVGAALDAARHRGHGFAVAGTAAAIVFGRAVSLTESRAGVVTVVVVVLGMAIYAGRARVSLRRQLVGTLLGLGILALAGSVGSLSILRMTFWRDQVWYKSSIAPTAGGGGVPASFAPGELTDVAIDLRNLGARPWPASGAQPVKLSYHWRDVTTGLIEVYDGLRTPLPSDVQPGASAALSASVRAPTRPGRYWLHFELVHEQVTWFGDRGDPGYDVPVEVVRGGGRGARVRTSGVTPDAGEVAAYPVSGPSRPQLWRAAFAAFRQHPLLGIGPDNFRHGYGRYLGLPQESLDDRLHANNWFFEILATLGLCGVVALGLVVVTVWRDGRRALARHGWAAPEGLLVFGLCAALAAYVIHGFLDYFLEFTPTYALVWLLAGMLAALADTPGTALLAGGAGPSQGPEQNCVSDDEPSSASLLAGGAGLSQGPVHG